MASRRAKPAVAISSSQRAVRVPRKRVVELVSFVAAAEGVRLSDIDVAVVGRTRMAALSRRWLARAVATDVLCFDLSDARRRGVSAQLVICGDVAAEQGRLRGTGPQRELMLYVVHGLLHLVGYEDSSARGAAKMHAREEELLEAFLARRRGSGRAKRPKR